MGLPLHVAFAPFTAPASSQNSLALASPIVVPDDALTAHVHIGRFAKQGADGLLFDKGSTKTPCELDIAYSQIEGYLVEFAGVFVRERNQSASWRAESAPTRFRISRILFRTWPTESPSRTAISLGRVPLAINAAIDRSRGVRTSPFFVDLDVVCPAPSVRSLPGKKGRPMFQIENTRRAGKKRRNTSKSSTSVV